MTERLKVAIQATIDKAYDNRDTQGRNVNAPLARLILVDSTHPEVESVAIFSNRSEVVNELVNSVGKMYVLPITEGKPWAKDGMEPQRQFSLGAGKISEIDPNTGKTTAMLGVEFELEEPTAKPTETTPILHVVDGGVTPTAPTTKSARISGLADQIVHDISGMYQRGMETGMPPEEINRYVDSFITKMNNI